MLYAWILFAQEKPAENAPGLFQLAPIFLIVIVFYFLIFLPGRKEKQQRQAMIGSLKKNDKVITSGGIIGVVVNLKEGTEEVTIRSDDTKLLVLKSSIARVERESDKDPSSSQVKTS